MDPQGSALLLFWGEEVLVFEFGVTCLTWCLQTAVWFPTLQSSHSGSPNWDISSYMAVYIPVAPTNVCEPVLNVLFCVCVNCMISRLSYRVGEVRR